MYQIFIGYRQREKAMIYWINDQ